MRLAVRGRATWRIRDMTGMGDLWMVRRVEVVVEGVRVWRLEGLPAVAIWSPLGVRENERCL